MLVRFLEDYINESKLIGLLFYFAVMNVALLFHNFFLLYILQVFVTEHGCLPLCPNRILTSEIHCR